MGRKRCQKVVCCLVFSGLVHPKISHAVAHTCGCKDLREQSPCRVRDQSYCNTQLQGHGRSKAVVCHWCMRVRRGTNLMEWCERSEMHWSLRRPRCMERIGVKLLGKVSQVLCLLPISITSNLSIWFWCPFYAFSPEAHHNSAEELAEGLEQTALNMVECFCMFVTVCMITYCKSIQSIQTIQSIQCQPTYSIHSVTAVCLGESWRFGQDYPADISMFKEMVQNADDAGATEVKNRPMTQRGFCVRWFF